MYREFAYVYDKLISADYKKWTAYYKRIFKKFGLSPKLLLDLGCGTGEICSLLSDEGYDMIGLDMSADMLAIAKNRRPDILFLNMDMTDFELYGTVDAAVSSLDCINYITDEDGVLRLFKLLKNYLNPGGIFIFDINTRHKLSKILGNNTFVSDEEDVFLVWENEFEGDKCTFHLTFFIKDDGRYQRFDEIQTQRAYSISTIKKLASQAELRVLGVYDAFGFNTPKYNSERIFFVLGRD